MKDYAKFLTENLDSDIYSVEEVDVTKANDVQCHGYSIRKGDYSVILYDEMLDHLFKDADSEESLEEYVERILKKDNICDTFKKSVNAFLTESNIDNVYPYILNKERNKVYCSEGVTKDTMDLLLVPFITHVLEDNSITRVRITTDMLTQSGLSDENFFTLLEQKIQDYTAFRVRSLFDVIKGFYPDEAFPDEDVMPNQLYVVDTVNYENGVKASVLLGYPKKLREVLQQNGLTADEYYILPSSTEEILILAKESDSSVSVLGLRQIVKEANQGTVSDNEFLSDSVYLLKGEELSIA